jgi:hypothetical protein
MATNSTPATTIFPNLRTAAGGEATFWSLDGEEGMWRPIGPGS